MEEFDHNGDRATIVNAISIFVLVDDVKCGLRNRYLCGQTIHEYDL